MKKVYISEGIFSGLLCAPFLGLLVLGFSNGDVQTAITWCGISFVVFLILGSCGLFYDAGSY
jgi:hypothetical protein